MEEEEKEKEEEEEVEDEDEDKELRSWLRSHFGSRSWLKTQALLT